MKHNLIIKPRPSDYLAGINSPIQFKAVSSGDWTNHLWFNENQRNPDFDTDGCAPFGANKSVDMQFDLLLSTAPASMVNQLAAMGFMDTGTDGQPHLHSSPRFTENLTGNGQNGNSIPECFDAIRKYGLIPWSSMPFNPTMTQAEYFAAPTAEQLALGQQFLNLVGGANFCLYHWIANDAPKNTALMQSAMLQAPLNLGIAVDDAGWNQVTPVDPPATQTVQHVVTAYKMEAPATDASDNYAPYLKVLDAGYPIPYVLQAVVKLPSIVPTPPPNPLPAPLPPNPTPVEESNWLTQVSVWINSILNSLKGRQNLGSINMNYSLLKSKTMWTAIILFVFNGFNAISGSIPSAYSVPISFVLTALIGYFHLSGVTTAATASAVATAATMQGASPKIVSGQ